MEYNFNSAEEIFMEINKRQIVALMLHSEMADAFGFLGLRGFKKQQEFRFICENKGHRDTKNFYLKACGKILPDSKVESKDVIPNDWYRSDQQSASTNFTRQQVQRLFDTWKEWEEETKELLEASANKLMEMGNIYKFKYVCELVKDVSEELSHLNELHRKLILCDYDINYIISIQHDLKCKYKEKMKHIYD